MKITSLNILFAIFFLSAGFQPGMQHEAEEYSLKAAFIYNFTKYIEWEKSSSGNDFVIGIIGACPIEEPLSEIAKTKMVNSKKIIIKKINDPGEMDDCDMIFIPQKNPFPITDILSKLNGKGTLTISEKEGYALKGAAINFIIQDNKIKFEANLKSMASSGLKASSQLLKLAIVVVDK